MDKINELINDFQRKAIYQATFGDSDEDIKTFMDARAALHTEFFMLQNELAEIKKERNTQRELIDRPAEAIYGEYHDMREELATLTKIRNAQREIIFKTRQKLMLLEKARGVCKWTGGGDAWGTDCGHSFVINEGTPDENEMEYCCYCGKVLVEVYPLADPEVTE